MAVRDRFAFIVFGLQAYQVGRHTGGGAPVVDAQGAGRYDQRVKGWLITPIPPKLPSLESKMVTV